MYQGYQHQHSSYSNQSYPSYQPSSGSSSGHYTPNGMTAGSYSLGPETAGQSGYPAGYMVPTSQYSDAGISSRGWPEYQTASAGYGAAAADPSYNTSSQSYHSGASAYPHDYRHERASYTASTAYPSHGYEDYNNASVHSPSTSNAYVGQRQQDAYSQSGMSAQYPPSTSPSSPTSASSSPKACSNCGATTTPMWRRNPMTHEPLCNACGIYLQTRHKQRPLELINASRGEGEAIDPEDEVPEGWEGPVCSHCSTRSTSVWRRSKEGDQLCNACGVYIRLRGKERPLSLRRNKVRTRTKHE